ncbi:MAG: hypothetical protein Q4A54_14050, partial [Parabacteroides sp.]|nr:hypothetical protein [Parabacteroides sp.]
MKKVLIICDLFPPAFGPRMGYLCKYLKSLGWQPIVLTEEVNEKMFTFLANECKVHYMRFYPKTNRFFLKLIWICIQILDICFHYKDICMYHKANKILSQDSFNLVLCSTYRTFPLKAAQKIAKKHELPWVADLRDIIEQYSRNEFITHAIPHIFGLDNLICNYFKKQNLRTRNQALLSANAVTTVSPWHVKTLQTYNNNTFLIYNGYDPEIFYSEEIKTKQFIITYTGRILSTAMRDPSLLFEGLATLYKQNQIMPDSCRVHWYVDDTSREILETMANKMGVGMFMDFKGIVPAEKIPSILNHSSILLLLTNKTSQKGPKGIMT